MKNVYIYADLLNLIEFYMHALVILELVKYLEEHHNLKLARSFLVILPVNQSALLGDDRERVSAG